jgi:hypothetical protein
MMHGSRSKRNAPDTNPRECGGFFAPEFLKKFSRAENAAPGGDNISFSPITQNQTPLSNSLSNSPLGNIHSVEKIGRPLKIQTKI